MQEVKTRLIAELPTIALFPAFMGTVCDCIPKGVAVWHPPFSNTWAETMGTPRCTGAAGLAGGEPQYPQRFTPAVGGLVEVPKVRSNTRCSRSTLV